MIVKREERGWPAHFICADRCAFRRNTLLTCGDKRIVISTIGVMRDPKTGKVDQIGRDRYYETMAFHAYFLDGTYWDADVTREVRFKSNWSIDDCKFDADHRANDMHESVVNELTKKLEKWFFAKKGKNHDTRRGV